MHFSVMAILPVHVTQFGSGKTLGARAGGSNPTYVYPAALKAVVRARCPQEVKDWQDPVGPKVP